MPNRPYDLPPVSALLSFEAAARHESFKTAAQELNVTPAAVSHQVKALENDLRQTLFHRHHRGVELTPTGAYLLVSLQRGLEGISDAISQLRSQASRAMITIQATTAVSALWLTPKLAQFWRAHGHVSVAQNVSDTTGPARHCDLSIHYGEISRESGDCRILFQDRIMALGSRQFAQKHPVHHVSDFARTPLIHLDAEDTGWTDWATWCAALGYNGPLASGFRVNNYVIALQAAQDDMGAVLGWGGLVGQLLETGVLVKLTKDEIASPLDFYIKVHPQASPRALFLCDWLLNAAQTGETPAFGVHPAPKKTTDLGKLKPDE
ncbi:LysR family transcriptional regulator [Rhodobacteraceae bacterium M382]|nr:LysR family transcriptional regulator [Rhodobacteraceae bacterium M382]